MTPKCVFAILPCSHTAQNKPVSGKAPFYACFYSRICISVRVSTASLVLMVLACIPAMANETLVIDINVVEINVNQSKAIDQLTQACESLDGNITDQADALRGACAQISLLDPNNPDDIGRLRQISDALAPEEVFALHDSLLVISDFQASNIYSRLYALRNPVLNRPEEEQPIISPEASEDDFSPVPEKQTGGGASSDLIQPIGGFINGHTSSGNITGGRLQQNADIASSSLTLGGDYRISNSIVAGLGVGLLQDETRFSRVSGGTDSDGINLTAFATWYETDEGYLDIVLDFGRTNYVLERSVSLEPDSSLIATSSPTATASTISFSGGRNFKPFGLDLGGYFRLAYTGATIAAYKESLKSEQPGYAALYSVKDQNLVSTNMVVGFNLSKAISTTRAVILPLLRIEYVIENNREKEAIEATLIDTGIKAQYKGDNRVGKYSNLGIGASAVFKRGKSAYAYYETHLQHDRIAQDWLKAGIRFEF